MRKIWSNCQQFFYENRFWESQHFRFSSHKYDGLFLNPKPSPKIFEAKEGKLWFHSFAGWKFCLNRYQEWLLCKDSLILPEAKFNLKGVKQTTQRILMRFFSTFIRILLPREVERSATGFWQADRFYSTIVTWSAWPPCQKFPPQPVLLAIYTQRFAAPLRMPIDYRIGGRRKQWKVDQKCLKYRSSTCPVRSNFMPWKSFHCRRFAWRRRL